MTSLKKVRLIGATFILFMSFWLIGAWLFSALRRLPQQLSMTLLGCWSATLASALRTIPFLIAFFIIIFTTGDAWRLYGNESGGRLMLLILIIAILSISAMVVALSHLDGGWRNVAIQESLHQAHMAELVRKTPAQELVAVGVAPIKLPARLYGAGWLRLNIYFLFWFTLIAHLISMGASF